MKKAALSIGILWLALTGCTSKLSPEAPSEPGTMSKADAAKVGGRSGDIDLCDSRGWYDDGECDDFCPDSDPDCGPICPTMECLLDCDYGLARDERGCDVCVCAEPPRCGGDTGLRCPDGHRCIDDPADDCDPLDNRTDCPGVCEPTPRLCMPTGILCDPECPPSGRLPGGAPCRRGSFNTETCTCEALRSE